MQFDETMRVVKQLSCRQQLHNFKIKYLAKENTLGEYPNAQIIE